MDLPCLKRPAELLAIEDKVFSSIGKQAGFPGCQTVDAPGPYVPRNKEDVSRNKEDVSRNTVVI